jgi:hypothetical protein
VLTEVKAYSSWQSAPTLLLSANGRAETDFVQIRNIDGLDPVKASVSTSPLGSVDGAAFTGSNVPSRNIVLTIHPNPDWHVWTYESLRRLLYSYFMPKSSVRLVFTSDDIAPVEIWGIVEGVEANPFSKDPELIVSIICPDPYFTAVDPEVITGQSVRPGGTIATIAYDGNVETGLYAKVTYVSGAAPTEIGIQVGDPATSYFSVIADVEATKYFEMSSIPRLKYVQNVDMDTGVIVNLLSLVEEGSNWPILQPGENDFSVITDAGVQDWELRYYERFGGL